MTDPVAHARKERARLIKAFAELEKPEIKESLFAIRGQVGSELQRVVRTEGGAISENWPPLSRAWSARKARLAKAVSIGQFTGKLVRALGRPTPRLRKSKKRTEVFFQSNVKYARNFTRGRYGGFVGGQATFNGPRFIGLTNRAIESGFSAIEGAVNRSIEKASRV